MQKVHKGWIVRMHGDDLYFISREKGSEPLYLPERFGLADYVNQEATLTIETADPKPTEDCS